MPLREPLQAHLINITVNMPRQMLWKKKVEQHESQQETKIMFRSGQNTSVMEILKNHIIKTSEFEAFVV
jgi:hypothetical protein